VTASSDRRRARDDARLLARLDRAYGADGGEEEAELRRRWRPLYRRVLEEETASARSEPRDPPEATG
jgi:hypothetical protein